MKLKNLIEQIYSRLDGESIEYMINNGVKEFIEIGPGKVLSGLVKRTNDKVLTKSVNTIDEIQIKMIDFKNKILITGATGGIGGSLVQKFISLNGNVLGTGTKVEKLNLLKKQNPSIKIHKFDISNHSKIESLLRQYQMSLVGWIYLLTMLE